MPSGVVDADDFGLAFEDTAAASILGGLPQVCGARALNLLLVPLGRLHPARGVRRVGAIASRLGTTR